MIDSSFKFAGIAGAMALAISASVVAQDALQRRVEDGGNGHWYALDSIKRGWSESRQAAIFVGGDLACLESAQENAFVQSVTPEDPKDGVQEFVAWIGLIRDCSTCDWYWVTQPDATLEWLNWAPGEPNYPQLSHNGGEMYRDPHPLGGQWNNASINDLWPSIVEWSADCNGDGIVDYGQIRDGTFADTDGNGVPDCCDVKEPCDPCLGDITGNGVVDAADLGILLAVWNTDGKSNPEADINGDGTVNAADLGILLGAWGSCQ